MLPGRPSAVYLAAVGSLQIALVLAEFCSVGGGLLPAYKIKHEIQNYKFKLQE